MGGLLGGPKGMLAPPSQTIGGAWPPWPPLFLRLCSFYRLEAKKRNLCNQEPEARVARGGFLIAKISLLSIG